MNCDETIPQLPLLVLDEVEGDVAARVREHVEGCARCAERLAELTATCNALDLVSVPEAPPLAPIEMRRPAPRILAWPRAAAAAALLLLAGGAGFVGGRLGAASAASVSSEPTLETIPASILTETLLAFDLRFDELEARHERDLLLLAQAVDRQQFLRDRGMAQQIDLLARATDARLISVAELVTPGEH